MTAAFRINLTALSLLALAVGMFLIYNSMTFSVVQRRPLFGALRCLGVTRAEIAGLVLIEALAVGVLGSALGLGLGVLLGQGAVRLVMQTINDLYFVVTVRGVVIAPESLVKGALIGVAATVISAALPAWEAAAAPPRLALARSNLEDRARRAVPVTALAALLVGGTLLALPPRNLATLPTLGQDGPGLALTVSFAGIFCVTIGFALLAPVVTLALLRGGLPLTSRVFGVIGRLASRSVTGALSRTAIAIAALMVAVSVTIGVGLMVGSFRVTVVAWLGQTLWGDIYISAPSLTATRSATPLDPQIEEIARGWLGAVRVDVLRSTEVASPAGRVAIAAVSDRDFTLPRIFVSTDGGRAAAAEAIQRGAVLASEPLANRLGLPTRGATVTLFTDCGRRPGSQTGGPVWGGRAGATQRGAAQRGVSRLRSGVCHHRRAAIAGRGRRVRRCAQRALLAPARAGARVGRFAGHRSDRGATAGRGAAGNRADGRGGRAARHPDRADPGPGADLYHQPPLVRLDVGAARRAGRLYPGAAPGGRRRAADRRLSGDPHGADVGGRGVAGGNDL
jgi:putative ABC transport system permease protein